MEPLKPSRRQEILADNPDVTEADIDEYQLLQAARASTRSRRPPGQVLSQMVLDPAEVRFLELHARLFRPAEPRRR